MFSVSWLVDFQWGQCGSIFSFLCHGWQTFRGVRVAQSLDFCVMVGILLVGFVWLNLLFFVSWLVDFQWGSCGSIFRFLCPGWQTFSGLRVAQSLDFCVMVGILLVGFVWLNLLFFVSWQVFSVMVSWQVDFQWGSCGSIFSFLCHGWQTFSGVRVAQSLDFCVMVGRLLVGFVWLNLQLSVSWLVNFQWGSCGSIFSFLCHGRQTFSGLRVSQSLVFGVMVGRLLVGSCGSNFSFLCHGWQTFSGVRVAQSLVFCVMVGRLLVGFVWLNLVFCVMVGRLLGGFVWLNLQFSVSLLVYFQWASCGSIFRFLCHGRYTFSGVRVAQSLVFCVMVGRLLVGFLWLNLQFSVSWQVDFQWVRVAQTLVFCVMVGRLLVGFVWLNLQFSVSWLVDFQWVRVAQTLVFCVMVGRILVGFVWLNLQFSVSWLVDFQWGSCGSIFSFLCHGRQTFSGVRVAQSLVFCVIVGRLLMGFVWLNLYVFCVMVGRLLVGSVWLNLQYSVSWLVDFQGGSCGSIFSFLCHGWQTFSGLRVAQSLVFCAMVGRLLVGSCGSNFSFLCHGWQTFSGVRVAQSLVFCVMVGRLLVGSCGSNFSFLCHGWQNFSGVRVAQSLVFCVMVGRLLVGFVWLNLQFSVSWSVDFQWGSCGSIFSFLCHRWQTFNGVRVAQSLCFLCHGWQILVGSVWLNLQFSVSWLVDFQGGSCGSIFSFLCHGWQTFSGLRVAQSLDFCVMVGILLGGFVWLNLLFFVSWLVDFQWGSCGSIFRFLCPGWQTFSGLRVAQSLDFCVMVGRLLVGFVWLNLLFFVSWLVDFQWGSCGSIFSFLCHGRQTFSGVRVAQSLVFCVMVGRLLVGFVWLNLQLSVSWLVNFQWGSCGSIFSFLCHGRQTFSGLRVSQSLVFGVMVGRLLVGSCGSNFSFLCHGWQTFSGVRVAQSLVFCVMVGRLLVGFVWLNLVFCVMVGRLLGGFVWLNLQFSVSWLVYFQWASCGSIFRFLCHGRYTFSGVRVAQSLVFCVMVGRLLVGSCGSNFSFLCHGWQTFSGVRVAQSLVFCVMVGRLLVGSCGSNFSFLCHGWQNFSGVRVAQSLVFCVMVGRLLVGFVWLNLQFSVSWSVDFQWGSCGSIFSFLCHRWQTFNGVRVAQSLCFLCHGWQTFSGVSVAQSLVFCVMVGRLLVGFVWLNLQFSVTWLVDFQWASCGSIFRFLCHGRYTFSGVRVAQSCFLCHGWQTFRGVRVAQSLVFCVLVGILLVGFVWLNLQISVSWQVYFQWGSCGSIFSFLCHGWQTFSGLRVAQSLNFCVMVGILLVGFVWLNLLFFVSWLVDFQWGSCGSIFRFLCPGWQTFSGLRVAQSLDFCVMVGILLVGFVWLNLLFFVSWLVDFQWGSCGSIFSFLCHGRQTFSGVLVAQSLVFCVMVGRLLVGFVWLNLQLSVSWLVNFQWGSCGSIFSFLCHGRQTFSGLRVSQSLVFGVMVGRLLVGSCGSNFSFLCHGWQTFSGVRVAQSLVFCVMVGRLLVGFVWLNLVFCVMVGRLLGGFVWLNLQFSVSWLVYFQWASCGSIFRFLCHGRYTFSGVRVAQSLVFCVMVGRLLVGFLWLNLQFSVSWQVDFQWVRVAQTLVFCVMVGRLLVGFVWLNLQFSVSWLVDFQWVRVAQTLVFCVMVGRILVGFVWLNLQFSVSWLVDFQWGSCGSIFSFLCHGRQTFSGVRVAQSLVFCVIVGRLLMGFVWLNLYVFCVMVGRLLVGSVWLNLQYSVSWLVDFQGGSCGSIFSFLCHGWQTFSGLRVAQSLVFCVMVGRLLVGSCGSNFSFLCHGWQTFSGVRVAQSLVFCVMVGRLLVGSCGSNFSFLCHGWQNFSGVRVAQSLVFCVMVGRLLVGFVWLNLQFSVSWSVDFQWGSCGSIFSFLCHRWQTFNGVRVAQSLCFLCHGWQTFSGVSVAQSLVFCVMVGRLLGGFVWLNLQFSVSWLVDFQWASCGSIFRFLCHGRYTFSGVRVAQSFVFCVMVGRLLVGFVWLNLQISVSWLVDFQWASRGSIFRFLCHGWQTFSGVRVAQSFVFCVMVGRLLVGFVWLNLQFSVSWQVDFQWGSCGSIFSLLCHGRQTFSGVRVAQSLAFCVMVGKFLVGFVWLNLQFFVSWQVDFQWASCVSIFSFWCHGWQTFSGFVWLKLQFSVSWLVDFQWGSCGSIFSFLCHGWQTFSGVRVAQSCFLCHGWQTFRGVRVAQSLVFCVLVGILLVGFVWLNLQISVSWQVYFQWGSCGSIFSFLCHGRQTFSGFVWLKLQFSVSWLVDFQWGSCGSIFSFLCHGWQTFSGFVWLKLQFSVSWLVEFQWGSCGSIFSFLCHGWQTFSGVRVAQSLVFCVMVGRLLVGFVWLNLQFSVSSLQTFNGVRVAQSLCFLCHGWQTFSGVSVAQSLVFCVMVGRLLVGFVWLNLQFSVSWLVDFQWASCGSIFRFLCHGRYTFSGVRVAQSCFLCHGWQTFRGVRVAQSLVFCVLVGILLVGFVWLNLQISVSWQVYFQWGSCGSIFSFLCHGWQTFSGLRVAQSLVFCVMVGILLVGFVWLNLLFFVSWLVDFQWGSCGSIFRFLCPGWQTFSGLRVAQSLDFCVMVGRLLVGFVWLNLQFFVSWLVDFQWGSCGSIFSFLCHGRQTFSGVLVAQSLVFCVMVGRLLVGFVWLNLQFSVSWLVDFQWGSCGSIFSFLCHGWQTFSGLRVAQSLVVMVGRLLVGFVWLNLQCHGWQTFSGFVWLKLQFSVSWLVDFQWGSCGSIFSFVMVGRLLVSWLILVSWLVDFQGGSCGSIFFSVSWLVYFYWASCGSIFRFLCHGRYTFSGVRVAQSLVFCVMVGRLLVGFVWLNLQFSVSWLVDFQWVRVAQTLVFQWGSCGSIFSFLCHGWQTFSGVRVAQSLVFCVMVGRLLVGFVWLNLQFSVSWLVDFQWGSCGSIFSFLCHGWQTFSGVRVAQSLVFCVMVGRLLVGFVWLNLQFSVSWLVDFQWGSCGSIFSFLCHGWQTFSGVRVAQSLVFCVMVGRLLVGFVWLNLQFSVSWLVDFQWGSCGSIFSFLCHGWQTFSGVRVAQSLVFCVMVGRLLVGFVWLNLQFSVSWLVDFQWGSCGSIFSFLCHGWQTFSGVRVAQSLVFCVMVGRLLVGFVWLNLQFSVSWLVDFQWGSCGSIFSFLCHGWQTFSGVRVAQSLVFCVMVGRLLVGFVWLNLQFSVSWLVDFQWGSCGSIFSFLCHGWQTFSGVRVAQSLVFCVMVGRLLVGFVWLNLQFSVSWLVDFQWGQCGSIFSILCHGWQTFSGVRVAQSLVFCVMVGRLLVGFVWLNLQFSVSWLVDFQWASCGSIFSFCVMVGRLLVGFVWLNLQFSVSWLVDFQWVRVAQSLVFCVMVGILLVGFVWLNLQISVSWLVDFQWGSCGSIFSFLCHGWQTFSGFVWLNLQLSVSWLVDFQLVLAQSLVFCVMVGRLLVGFVWLNLVFCVMVGRLLGGFVWLNLQVSWLVYFQWASCGSIFSFLCHGRDFQFQGFVWLNLQFSVSWQVDFQWGSCGSIFSLLCHGRQTFSGFVWLNLQLSVSWLVNFQWASCGSIFSFLCHGRYTFSGVRVAQSLVFCVMVGRLLVGFLWLNLFRWGSCGSIFSFLCHGWQTFSGVRVAQSLVFCVMVGRLLVGSCGSNFSFLCHVEFQWGSCGSIFSFLCHGWQTFSGVRVAQSLVFCVMVGRLLVGFVWLNLQFSVSSLVDF